MTPVRMTKAWKLWNAGEVAGFPADEAARMIEAGIAAPYDGEDASPSETAESVTARNSGAQGSKPPRKKG